MNALDGFIVTKLHLAVNNNSKQRRRPPFEIGAHFQIGPRDLWSGVVETDSAVRMYLYIRWIYNPAELCCECGRLKESLTSQIKKKNNPMNVHVDQKRNV